MLHIILPLLIAISILFSVYSPLGDFLATPKFWRDEAIPFEIARTYYELGVLDVVVAPGQVDGRPYLTHATGFPLLIPMAGIFSVFGVGVFQARVFMVFWILATIIALFFILKSFFGFLPASWGALNVATFSSFYANGRTFTGEVPGFLFLILAIYLFFKRKNYFFSGMLFGLAAVTKPSVYLLLVPTTLVYLIIMERQEFWKKAVYVVLGALPIFLIWIYVMMPNPLSLSGWTNMVKLYRSPFNAPSVLANFSEGLKYILTHATIIYFSLITIATLAALYHKVYPGVTKRVLAFTYIYGLFSFIYFLRSPGYLRYILAYELLILALLYPAIDFFSKKIKVSPAILAFSLVIFQSANYLLFNNIQSETKSIQAGDFINRELLADRKSTVGLVYMPTVAALIPSDRKYQIGTIGGRDTYGKHPLSYEPGQLPTFIIAYNNNFSPFENVLRERYKDTGMVTPTGQEVYKRL